HRLCSHGAARYRRPRVTETTRPPVVMKVGAGLALVILLLPVVVVILAGLNAGDYLTFPPQGLSLRWVIAFLRSATFLNAYLFSFGLALLATLISTTIGTMASIFLTRSSFTGINSLRAFFLSPIVLPGVVLGLALYVFYVSTDFGLAQSLIGLLIG